MAVFGLRTKTTNLLDHSAVEKFADDTARRLDSPNPYTNPFRGNVRKFSKKEVYVFDIEPLYFNFSLFGWPMALVAFVFRGVSPWVLPGVILGAFGYFWTSHFFYFVAVRGLRRAGYYGPVDKLNEKQIIREVVL